MIFGVSARRKQAKQDTLRAMQKKETSHRELQARPLNEVHLLRVIAQVQSYIHALNIQIEFVVM